MNYEFQNTSFHTAERMTDAIAEQWITAAGMNSDEAVAEFAQYGAKALSTECVDGWGLDAQWMQGRDIDRSDIAAAFQRYIDALASKSLEA